MKDPKVLLADEPTSALDRATSNMIIELLVQLTKEDGIATMVVTHDRGHINECDRAVEMRDGKMTHVEHELI
jgi:putative ABC transport system ATP-binding protein